jgi:N-acyl homoserine lactone hydrolase
MKLYMFQCGTVRTKKHLLVEGPETDAPFEVPVPFFLIEHQDGNVLFDTGQSLSAVDCTANGNYIPVMTEADYVSNQLEKVGLKTTDITHIVLSHLHSDHAGGLEAFKGTTCYIQKDELQHANNRNVIDKYPLRWSILNGDFGDGRIHDLKVVFTPGHTPGHQSLMMKLKKTGKVMLTADAVYTGEILDNSVMPGVFHNREETVRTIEMIKIMRRNGVRIITGHDPKSWTGFNLAPAYYD